MPIKDIVCAICTDIFINSDVQSTSCGHLFHSSCLSSWLVRQKSCPQCRLLNPTCHKLYLSFEEPQQIPKIEEDVEVKLASAKEKIIELQGQIEEQKKQFLQLQTQFTATDNLNTELEEKLSTMKDMESEFMELQSQYTESSEHRKDLEDRINQLFVRNDCKAQDLNLKNLEKVLIKTKFDSNQSPSTDGILNEKIRILEQKIKHFSNEFEKEIKLSTQLSIENMKLRSRVNHLQNTVLDN